MASVSTVGMVWSAPRGVNPAAANLTGGSGLPAWPFRADDWPAVP
jgi:hypothetical protein